MEILRAIARNTGNIVALAIGAAVLVAVAGTFLLALCGGVAPLPDGETCMQCAREWIGALSGWMAAGIATYIGVKQLAPLVAQSKVQRGLYIASTNMILADVQDQCRKLNDEVLQQAMEVSDPTRWVQNLTPELWVPGITRPANAESTAMRAMFLGRCENIDTKINGAIRDWIRIQTPVQHHAELDHTRREIVEKLRSVQTALANVRLALPRLTVRDEDELGMAAEEIVFRDQIREEPAVSCFRELANEIDELRTMVSTLEHRSEALRTLSTTD